MKLKFNFKKGLAITFLVLGVSSSIGINAAESVEISTDCEISATSSISQDLERANREKIKSFLEDVKQARHLVEELNNILDKGPSLIISLYNKLPDLKNALCNKSNSENVELFEEFNACKNEVRSCLENIKKVNINELKKLGKSVQEAL